MNQNPSGVQILKSAPQVLTSDIIETIDAISHIDSEQSLLEHIEHLDTLSRLTGYSATYAKEIVSDRLAEFEQPDHGEHRASFSRQGGGSSEEFGDAAVTSLFGILVR